MAGVQRSKLRPSDTVGCGMMILSCQTEWNHYCYQQDLKAPLSFLETINEDSFLDTMEDEPEPQPAVCQVRVVHIAPHNDNNLAK